MGVMEMEGDMLCLAMYIKVVPYYTMEKNDHNVKKRICQCSSRVMRKGGDWGYMGEYRSEIVTEITDRRENSDIVMAVRSIFSINNTRPRLVGKEQSQGMG